MSLLLDGIGVSRGVAIGKVRLLERNQPELYEYAIPDKFIDAEVRRYRSALKKAAAQLSDIRNHIPDKAPADVASFIDAHLLMLNDSLLAEAPVEIIRTQNCNAEWALKLQRDKLVAVFDEMEDPYLRTRKDDIEHVIRLIQMILLNQETREDMLSKSLRGHIVVADELTPADAVMLEHQNVAGFITEYGGPLSHTAILARSLGIPAVVGIHNACRLLAEEESIILDGGAGMIIAGADAGILRHFRKRQEAFRRQRRELDKLRNLPARSLDGVDITLHANIELKEDLRALRQVGALGVGLYRTEFLYMNRDTEPDEDEQLRVYRQVVRSLDGKPLTIRTLDLGADKECGTEIEGALAPNPALGLRAIRRSLKDAGQFMPQLRAILRAAANGPVRLMFPMLTSVQELDLALELVEQAKAELRSERKRFDENLALGAMIEVPAAALVADAFAERLDFLSIGTNDLIQYTLAIDRIDEEVNYLYDPLHPSVLKLIHMTLQAGSDAGTPVSMCGEMAGDPRYTRLLLGLGLREFSMQPATMLEVKRVIQNTRIDTLAKPTKRILRTHDSRTIHALLEELNEGLVLT
ncbi:MAG: phosphoenolpyruvate--protein phosphotransferase [Gammaproteobacteria bacterium]|jgi:phosphotransferase system enzyme I (PtsI)